MFDRYDGRLVCPLLREQAILVNQRVESRAIVRTEAREGNLIVRGEQDIHGIDLQKPDLSEQPTQMTGVHRAMGPRSIESLSGEGNAPSSAQRE